MAIDVTALAQVRGVDTKFVDLRGGAALNLPQRIALIGQGATASTYATTKADFTSAAAVGAAYGFGSPVHLAAKQLFPLNGDGVGTVPVTVFPLDDDGSGVAASGNITPAGAQTEAASYIVRVNNIDSNPFVISVGDSVATIVTAMTAAVNAVLDMPIVASDGTTEMAFAAKWAGVSSNDIFVEVIGSTTAGTTFTVTQATGGLVNPGLATALDQLGNVWYTLVVNCLDIADTTALGLLSTTGEGRWGQTVKKPFIAFTGNTEAVVATAIAIPNARTTDRVNSQLVAPGSNDLPFVVAARGVARIAVLANNNPPHDYAGQTLTGITPGTDAQQWTFVQRDQAIKGGSSTIEVVDGVVEMSDTVTFYHPTSDPAASYRYVVDVIKLMNIIYNVDLIFTSSRWQGKPLIPDGQPTVNPDARSPRAAVAEIAALIDSLGNQAILSAPEVAKANTRATIDTQNPKRLNVVMTVQLSGNTNIISTDLNFGFFFGGAS